MKRLVVLLFASVAGALAHAQSAPDAIERSLKAFPPGSTDLIPRTGGTIHDTPPVEFSNLEVTTTAVEFGVFPGPLLSTPELNNDVSAGAAFSSPAPVVTAAPADAPAPKPASARLILEQIRFADTAGKDPEFVFILGNFAYRSLADLKQGIRRLPKGAQITWSPSCTLLGGEPLSSPEALADLTAHCTATGVALVVVPSG